VGEQRSHRPGRVRLAQPEDFEETGDEVRSQGWTPFILDTNGQRQAG